MSESAPSAEPSPEPPRHTGSQAVMTLFGILLLLPGLCSLLVALDTKLDPNEPMFGTLIAVWIMTFALAVLGVVLMCMARKKSGQPQ